MSINTHGIIPHCKSMLSTRSIIHIFRHLDFRSPLHSRLDRPYWKAASRRSARIADNTDERQTDGINSDHPAARASLWRWVWVLPRRLLPSRRTRWDRRRSRVDPCRPRDRVAGARAHRGPLSLSFERSSWSCVIAQENRADVSPPLLRAWLHRSWLFCWSSR